MTPATDLDDRDGAPVPSCETTRARLADLADGLLDAADAEAVEAHVAGCASCARALERARSLAAAIAAPWDVAEPPPDLLDRVRAAAAAASPSRDRGPRHAVPVARWASVALRYGVAFAAGVVVALAVTRGRPDSAAGV